MRKVIKLLLTSALIFSLVFFNHRVFAQNKCNCWVNSKTGETVGDYPEGSKPDLLDKNHAFNSETGDNFHRDKNCRWVNSKTGELVSTSPSGAKRDLLDPNHAFNSETGDNFHRVVPCPPQTPTKKNTVTKTAKLENTSPINFPHNEIFVGFSLIREDNGSNGFNTYGGQVAYTRNLCWRGGLTGDMGVNFGSNGGVDYTKFNILAGGTYYPIKTSVPSSDFSFSIHALAGISSIRSSYSGISNSSSYFTLDVGPGFNYYFGNKLGLGLRAGYMPSFGKGNTSNNFRVALGLDFR